MTEKNIVNVQTKLLHQVRCQDHRNKCFKIEGFVSRTHFQCQWCICLMLNKLDHTLINMGTTLL